MHWGDGNTDTYATNGVKTHTYADGPNSYTITVDLVDEDGTYLNRGQRPERHRQQRGADDRHQRRRQRQRGLALQPDPGQLHRPGHRHGQSYIVHWGDGNTDTYASNGAKSHTYADGPASRTITVDLVDEDGTTSIAPTPSTYVDNVAPSATFNAPAAVNEGCPSACR